MGWRYDPDPKEGFPWTWEKIALFAACLVFWGVLVYGIISLL